MYIYFDAHCDTMSKMYKAKTGLDSRELMVNVHNLEVYKSAIHTFALFNSGDLNKKSMIECFDYFKNECKKLSDLVSVCTSAKEIDKNASPLSAILAIEGLGNQPDFSPGDVKDYYDMGIRFISLCWNDDNMLCGGCDGKNTGITELGKQTLAQMEKHKITLDVSHMSDKSFWESFEYYSMPICATHSACRAIHGHRRNLTDEQFEAIVKRGGVCGINFYPLFLCDGKANINSVIKHIEHFMSLGGENSIGLGSDFDGINETPDGLESSLHIHKLIDNLLALNYSEEAVEKIAFRNFKNLFKKFTSYDE